MYWSSKEGIKVLHNIRLVAEDVNYEPAELVLKVKSKFKDTNTESLNQAIEIVLARKQANELELPDWTSEGLFTRRSLEQATHPSISLHHAAHFNGVNHLIEIGSGAGFDTAALSKAANEVTTLEPDPVLAKMTSYNLALQGIDNVLVLNSSLEDLLSSIEFNKYDGLWADPSRRTKNHERIYNPEQYSPPLSKIIELPIHGVTGIKVSPGVDCEWYLPDWKREWIGFDWECREQVLWKGANVRDGSVSLVDLNIEWVPGKEQNHKDVIEELELAGHYLIEPHPALIPKWIASYVLC